MDRLSPTGKRICLVIPPSTFLLDERVFPSLGVLKIAAVLESAGECVDVLDLSGISNFTKAIEDYIQSYQPDICGISATTPQMPAVNDILGVLRQSPKSIRTILGGPHVSLIVAAYENEKKSGIKKGRSQSYLDSLKVDVDVLVAGDGEIAALEAIKEDAPWLINSDEKGSDFFMSNAVYDQTPYPAREKIDLESYKYAIDGKTATSLIAQLGCPFSCGFCGGRASRSLRIPRTRSVATIIKEVRSLYETYGYTGFMFFDDELNVNRKVFMELLSSLTVLQKELGVEFSLRGFVKAELFDEEQAHAMYQAGFRWLLCGFESADPRILENIQKRASLEDNNRAVSAAKKAGLKVKALMSCGHPGESEASIRAIHQWLVKNQVDDFDCTIITPYPGTPYHDEAVLHSSEENTWVYSAKNGDRLYSYHANFVTDAQYYKGDPNDGYKAFVFTDYLSSKEIVELRNWVEAETRKTLNIPYPQAQAAIQFEHSMGQGLPMNILKSAQSHVKSL